MSEILVDNLTGKTSAGDITVTSEGGAATMQLQQGLAKSWNRYESDGTASIENSFNIASITDNGTGNITSTFSSNMSNANHSAPALATSMNTVHQGEASSSVTIIHYNSSHSASDVSKAMVAVLGDLA